MTTSVDEPVEEESKLDKVRRKRPGIDHLIRANDAFDERYGNHYAAAITYFSVLSLFPLIMIAFAVAGFVLAGNQDLLRELQEGITSSAPAGLGDTLNDVVDQAIKSRGAVGVFGLLGALYAGLGWMSNLRDALTALWGMTRKPKESFFKRSGKDLLSLFGLGIALVVSFGLTAAGSGLGHLLLKLVGLQDESWALFLLRVGTIVLSLAANWLVFLWVLSRLPRERVHARSAMKGALIAAVGFEILKQVATIYLASVASSPTGALFGPIIGLLVFANLVSRFLLFVTAWTATAKENLRPPVPQPPAPAIIRPTIEVRRGPDARTSAGLLGAGAVGGLALRGWLRRRR
ncbi:membrane protein [Herbihabitans rhizosphaerae]|uniref:Membrane protein n=1 Tax=Herbihabitans rhizosphaerae TaxID=1872711 RepID=A0A4Q7KNT5_9PSEU|nr:inner membrane protein YhjD [Herbihabitans rhizosphaerae]RZS36892.1 membrane protein [Herbihabitans rhizosphaerae]